MNHFFDWVHILLERFNGAQIISERGFESFDEGSFDGVWWASTNLREINANLLLDLILTILVFKIFRSNNCTEIWCLPSSVMFTHRQTPS